MATLILHQLRIGYSPVVIQDGLELRAPSGQMICLLGQNGCGKSTLLRTLAGLQPALSGSIRIDETDLLALSERERAKQMAVVLTDRLSVDRTTVYDIVAMGRYPHSSWTGHLSAADHEVIRKAISDVEMTHKSEAYFNNLSDGEKQRVLIAKAIAQETPYILLDEPTAHLDLPNRIKTLILLRELAHQSGRTVLISTHELDLALQTADLIWLMMPGQGVAVGRPEELIASGEFQRAFQDEHFRFVGNGNTLKIELLS